jgi:glyoxylase-like metal-dependent hydrolase (beta-lactamase superfamily II)
MVGPERVARRSTDDGITLGFAQTPGDLVIWAPDANVVWVGNMIQAPLPPLAPRGAARETIATLERLRDFPPEDATIIPGRGRPMRIAEFPLRYLHELDSAVQSRSKRADRSRISSKPPL